MIKTQAKQNESILSLYFKDIGNVPLLTKEQEINLAKRISAGDCVARDLMIKSNLRLVVTIARQYENMGLPLMDLISEGNIGLMIAVDKFDPIKHENRFSSYAAFPIKQKIRKALLDKSRIIRLPAFIGQQMTQIYKAKDKLEIKLGRTAMAEEIADEIGMTAQSVRAFFDFNTVDYLDDYYPDDEEDKKTVHKKIPLQMESEFDEEHDKEHRSMQISKMIEQIRTLPERLQIILSKRFGLNDTEAMSLEQIGKELGITRERIRQLQVEALERLQKRMKCFQ